MAPDSGGRMRYAWYSELHAQDAGKFYVRTKNGECVFATDISNTQETPIWQRYDDMMSIGEIVEVERDTRGNIAYRYHS